MKKQLSKAISQHGGKIELDENGEEKKCFICGATTNLVRTECCGKWICDDEDEYVPFSYAHNSCHRNHRRYTLCAYHHDNGHKGDWKTCPECRKMAEPEMVAWFGTNEYNWEKMPNPPKFEPTRCHKCGKIIKLPEGGYSHGPEGYTCAECLGVDSSRHASLVDAMRDNQTLKLKLELRNTKIKRVVTLPGDISLEDFHYIIQGLFGFERRHLWKFEDSGGNVYSSCRDPIQDDAGDLGSDALLDAGGFMLEDILPQKDDVLKYKYDFGDGWEIRVTRMRRDPRDGKIACLETVGTNAIEGIGGFCGLGEFTEALRLYAKEERTGKPHRDIDSRITEWGYDDAGKRRKFLDGPTKSGLTKLLLGEIGVAGQRQRQCQRRRQEEAEQERGRNEMFRIIGRNEPCPCGSGKKFKKCCGANK